DYAGGATAHADHSDRLHGPGDAVASGYLRNIARPEGNITGFSSLEPSIAGKWLELLKEAAPHLARVAVIFNRDLSSQIIGTYVASIEAAASALGVKAVQAPARNAVDIAHAADEFAVE